MWGTERESKSARECSTSGTHKKSTPLESSWREREKERVKTLAEEWTKNMFPKPLMGKKERVFNTANFLSTGEHKV